MRVGKKGNIFTRSMLALAAFVLIGLLGASPAAAIGTIFVSGDSNIANPLGMGGVPEDFGNQQFYLNMLQGGSNVVVHGGSTYGWDTITRDFYQMYGINSSILTTQVTSGALSSADLLISIIPSVAYTGSEIAAMNGFLNAGGSIMFTGENSTYFSANNANINAALSGLGSSMNIVGASIDAGYNTLTGTGIATDPFTSGVSTFTYAYTSNVSGGTSLFNASNAQAFLAYETMPVPEPSTLLLLGSGLTGLGFVRRRLKARKG